MASSVALALASASAERSAHAQVKTFKLDRLEIAGGPDDGIALFRPQTQQRNIFFGQMALGYSLRPLKVTNITSDAATIRRTDRSSVIQDQFTVYGTAGFQVLDRATFAVTFPWSPIQTGENPDYGTGNVSGPGTRTTLVSPDGPAAQDLRLDFRGVLYRTDDRKGSFGAQLSIFAPTGSVSNLGGDNGTGAMIMLTGERTVKFITLVANLGVHFRPRHAINDPVRESGLGIGNELRWAVGGMVPFKDGKYRLGLTFFGQTGIESDQTIIGDTVFRRVNTPVEWQVEGRMKFGPSDHWWLGAGAGSRFFINAYGSPDFRVVGLIGTYLPILESDAKSPESRRERQKKWRELHQQDRDNDGIPDDIDACPDEAEDHQGNDPSDGCPMPPDRDGDGIPDQFDKCPDQPEDKDGVDDGDGCPEDDADQDGIPDVEDACKKEPGQKSPDPKKNGCPSFIKVEGNVVRILQQVHFATGSTTILPESFPMLQEITNLLKANKGIKRMSIEGHTDNRGGADLNKKLSQGRADSVMNWLTQHGVEASRLEAHGFGLEKPIETNDTDQGRAANRRVEFKILDEEDSNAVKKN